MTKIPNNLQAILWSQDVKSLNLKRDKNYIVHQVLSYGSLHDLKWLFQAYPEKEIKNTFTNVPFPVYNPKTLHFIKELLLHINKPIDEKRYLKSIT